jgi:hypothetical protein
VQCLFDRCQGYRIREIRQLSNRHAAPTIWGPAFAVLAHGHNTSGVGGHSTVADIRITGIMKHESRLGGAASGKTLTRDS